jgi:hypothetical protein
MGVIQVGLGQELLERLIKVLAVAVEMHRLQVLPVAQVL